MAFKDQNVSKCFPIWSFFPWLVFGSVWWWSFRTTSPRDACCYCINCFLSPYSHQTLIFLLCRSFVVLSLFVARSLRFVKELFSTRLSQYFTTITASIRLRLNTALWPEYSVPPSSTLPFTLPNLPFCPISLLSLSVHKCVHRAIAQWEGRKYTSVYFYRNGNNNLFEFARIRIEVNWARFVFNIHSFLTAHLSTFVYIYSLTLIHLSYSLFLVHCLAHTHTVTLSLSLSVTTQ